MPRAHRHDCSELRKFLLGHSFISDHYRLRVLVVTPQRVTAMNILRNSPCWSRISVSVAYTRAVGRFHGRTFPASRLVGPGKWSTSSICVVRPGCRQFQHLASQPSKPPQQEPAKPTEKSEVKSSPPDGAVHLSVAQQRKNDWAIIKRLSGNLWPKNDWGTRSRVILGMGLLVAGKVSRCGPYIMCIEYFVHVSSF